MKMIYLLISFGLGIFSLKAQSVPLTKEEKKRVELLRSFGEYVQKTPLEQIDAQQLQPFVTQSDSSRVEGSRPWKFYRAALEQLDLALNGMNLAEYDAVPWNKFADQRKLPKMVWDAEPITNLMGTPMPTGDREAELAEGRRKRENMLVIFKKSEPDVPVHHVLFDEKTGKIVSWVLIRQGGLHYFWLL